MTHRRAGQSSLRKTAREIVRVFRIGLLVWNQQHQTMIEIVFQISERQPVAALIRTPARARDEHGNVAVAFTVGRQQHQFRTVVYLYLRADDELVATVLGGDMRTHHARQRTFIGDRQRTIAQRLRARDQFFGM